MSAIIALLDIVTHIFAPFNTRVKNDIYNHHWKLLVAIRVGSMKINNTTSTAATVMHTYVHVTIASLFPCFPAYFAPINAKMIEGSIPITLKIVPSCILPIIIPNSIVVTTAWLAVWLAILSELAATMNVCSARLDLTSSHHIFNFDRLRPSSVLAHAHKIFRFVDIRIHAMQQRSQSHTRYCHADDAGCCKHLYRIDISVLSEAASP